MAPLLTVEKLRAGYGPIDALHDIDLHVDAGEIVTIIGANGAGKTTTLMTLSGVVKARGGRVLFDGHDLTRKPPHEIVRLGLAQSPEGRKIFPRLSVLENLQMGAFTRSDKPGVADDIEKAFGMFPILRERKGQAGGLLSGGQQQMLAIARALMARPKLLMLDEPSLGLAPQIVVQIFEVVRDLNRRGTSVLLVEQNARMALKVAHRGYVLETGRVTLSDKADALLTDPRVRAAYLGEVTAVPSSPETRLQELHLTLPAPPAPAAVYKRAVRVGNLVYVSGHVSSRPDGAKIVGKVGDTLTLEQGKDAARQVGLSILATLRTHLGSLDKVKRLIKSLGLVNCTAEFGDQPTVVNGYSELMKDVFGDDAGVGARSAVGSNSLPGGVAVEIEAIFEVE